MRLVHISDLHFGAIDPAMPPGLRRAIAATDPDLIVVSGDLTQRGRRAEFEHAAAFLKSIPYPQLVIPGNHDIQGSWMFWQRFLCPWRNYQTHLSPDLNPTWRSAAMIVAGANSARPAGWYLDWSRGRLSRAQMRDLAGRYSHADASALRVLAVHHPPAAPPHGTARHLIGRLARFASAVNEAGVDLVLSGHFHMSYAQALILAGPPVRRSCVLSSVSTATSHRLKGEPNGFHLIEGDARGLRLDDWRWTGAAYEQHRSWLFTADQKRNWVLQTHAPPGTVSG